MHDIRYERPTRPDACGWHSVRAYRSAAYCWCLVSVIWLPSPVLSPAGASRPPSGRAYPAQPRRIVSLSPGTTELLFDLGLQGRIVADTAYCDYPPAARSLPKIGDVNTSVEKVVAQHPDLVVADRLANNRAIPVLQRLGLRVVAVSLGNIDQIYTALASLGEVTGQRSQAARLVQSLRSRVNAVKRAVAHDARRPRVLDIDSVRPLMVVGSANFMDDMIEVAGGVNGGRRAGAGWRPYSPELVVVDKPDVILTDQSDVNAVLEHAGWSDVPAVRNRAVFSLGAASARPGPRLVDALEELARKLHPTQFPSAQ